MPSQTIDPNEDGITHLNVYSQGKTELGRLLTNFALTPFKHPDYGRFASMEGFWYWLSTGQKHDRLRRAHGAIAKKIGRSLERVPCTNFKEEIEKAIRVKIKQTPEIIRLMRLQKPLPLKHYYVYHMTKKSSSVIEKPEHNWQLEVMDMIWQIVYARAHPDYEASK